MAKFIWLVLFLAFSGGTVWLVTTGLIEYFDYEVVSKTEIFNERPVEFPTITICDNNPFSPKLTEDLIHNITLYVFKKDIENMTCIEAFICIPIVSEIAKMQAAVPEFGDKNRDALAPLIEPIFFYNKMSTSDYSYFYMYDYGYCFYLFGLWRRNRSLCYCYLYFG